MIDQFHPRDYQQPFLSYMSEGGKRAFLVWHRRAGKNMCAFQWLLSEALVNVGLYYYVFPSLKQAKKILWEGKTGNETDNKKFIDYINPDWIWPNPRDGVNQTDMTVKLRHPQNRLKEGSMIQLVGTQSDGGKKEADHLRGTNPRGIVMDEYSEQNPIAWQILSPILVENGGWAVFTLTPKGPNHAFEMYNQVRGSDRWFTQVLDVTMTKRADGSPVVSQEDIDLERSEGKDEAYILQEYYCSWQGINKGSYYTYQIDQVYAENRFTPSLYKPQLDCITSWDIGHDDETVVLIGQPHGDYTYWIDGFKVSQRDLKWCWAKLQEMSRQRGYRYAAHYMPWDIRVHEWGASVGRLASAYQLGMKNIRVSKKLSVEEGHDIVRREFSNWIFDSVRMAWALSDLGMYCSEYDEKEKILSDKPKRSKHKHTADAFRTYATAPKIPSRDLVATLPTQCNVMYSPMEHYEYTERSEEERNLRRVYNDPLWRTKRVQFAKH